MPASATISATTIFVDAFLKAKDRYELFDSLVPHITLEEALLYGDYITQSKIKDYEGKSKSKNSGKMLIIIFTISRKFTKLMIFE